MLAKHPVPLDAIKLFQINMPTKHIVDSIVQEFNTLGISDDKFYTKLDELGYNGPPMALVCLDKIIREETLNSGDYIASFVTEVSKFMQAGYFVRRV